MYHHDLSFSNLNFSADLKEVYAQDEGKIIFLIGYNDVEWNNYNDNFHIPFWKQDKLKSKTIALEETGKAPSMEITPGNNFVQIGNMEYLNQREQVVINDNLHLLPTNKEGIEQAFTFSVSSDEYNATFSAGEIDDGNQQNDITEKMILDYADKLHMHELQHEIDHDVGAMDAGKEDIANGISETQQEKEEEATKGKLLFAKNKSGVDISLSDISKCKRKVETVKVRK